MKANEIALRIARCSNFAGVATLAEKHPCRKILGVQVQQQLRQVPEPFRGRLRAPILFVASNPSLDPDDDSLRSDASDTEVIHYFSTFPESFPRIRLLQGGERPNAVRFWSFVRARAAELMSVNRTAIKPGIDFAITEVVHCKSRHEIGVEDARPECGRFMPEILGASGALVVVALGQHAQQTLEIEVGSVDFRGTRAHVALPHSNAREPRTFLNRYSSDSLSQLRTLLATRR